MTKIKIAMTEKKIEVDDTPQSREITGIDSTCVYYREVNTCKW